jgi:hypothetical protein
MKAIALGAFGAALLASAAPAAPLNATTMGSAEVSNVDQVSLVCNEYGRCCRTRGPRYVQRYYEDDPSYVVGRGYNYYAGPGYYDRGYGCMVASGSRTMIAGSSFSCIAGFHRSCRSSRSSGPRRSCVSIGPAFAATGVGSRAHGEGDRRSILNCAR